MTIHVPAADLQARLSELVDAVKRGEKVLIEQAGVVKARLITTESERPDLQDVNTIGTRQSNSGSYSTSVVYSLEADDSSRHGNGSVEEPVRYKSV